MERQHSRQDPFQSCTVKKLGTPYSWVHDRWWTAWSLQTGAMKSEAWHSHRGSRRAGGMCRSKSGEAVDWLKLSVFPSQPLRLHMLSLTQVDWYTHHSFLRLIRPGVNAGQKGSWHSKCVGLLYTKSSHCLGIFSYQQPRLVFDVRNSSCILRDDKTFQKKKARILTVGC